LLTRAVALLPADDERRLDLLQHLAYAHYDAGTLEEADRLFSEALERAGERTVLRSRATVGRLAVGAMLGGKMAQSLAGIERELPTLEMLADSTALAEAYREAAKIESHGGRSGQADRLFGKAVENAKASGNRRIEADILLWRMAMQCWGYLSASEGIRVANEVLEQRVGGMAEAFALVVRARYRALQADLAGGRADMEAGRALIRDYGAAFYIAGSGHENGQMELESGDPSVAERELREAHEMYEQMGGGHLSAAAASLLSRACIEQGKLDEAERFVRICEATMPVDDIFGQIEYRAVHARVLAQRGAFDAAEPLAREAVELAEQTDYFEHHAAARLALAEALRLSGRADDARTEIETAIELYERKESVFGVERARARLRELAGEALAERD
jgi:tetratricopeptide (TPR) repeat protein